MPDVSVPDAAQAPDRWFTLPTGGLLYGDGTGGVTVAGLAAWQDCPERTAAIHALARWCRERIAIDSAAQALLDAIAPSTNSGVCLVCGQPEDRHLDCTFVALRAALAAADTAPTHDQLAQRLTDPMTDHERHTARIDVTWQPTASIGENEAVVRLLQGVATSLRENLRRWDLTGLDVTLHIDPPDSDPHTETLWEGSTVPASIHGGDDNSLALSGFISVPPGTRVRVVRADTPHGE